MAICFLDRSAVVKRHVPETGSAWIQGLTAPSAGGLLSVARTNGAKVVASAASGAAGSPPPMPPSPWPCSAETSRPPVRSSICPSIEVRPGTIADATDMAERRGLRGYDSVQLAAALGLAARCLTAGAVSPLVIAADAELDRVAAGGQAVDDPNTHP